MAGTDSAGDEPRTPTERADRGDPGGDGRGEVDRPGFSLGGGGDKSAPQGALPETGPVSDPTLGDAHPAGKSQLTSNKGTPA